MSGQGSTNCLRHTLIEQGPRNVREGVVAGVVLSRPLQFQTLTANGNHGSEQSSVAWST